MIEASGCIFLSITTGRVMMQLRSEKVTHAKKWGFFGGKSEDTERPSETLYREIEEEVGSVDIKKVIPVSKFTSKNGKFIYNSFVVLVDEEFIPNGSVRVYGTWSSTHKATGKDTETKYYAVIEYDENNLGKGTMEWFDLGGVFDQVEDEEE